MAGNRLGAQLISVNFLTEADFYFGKSGFINYFFKAAKGVIEQPGPRVRAIILDPGMMAGKKKHPVISSIQHQLHQLLLQLCNQCETSLTVHNTR